MHRRDLPWRRRAHDPYAQWVAEIMLQQTRVETVVRYYQRFLDAFPTLRALAAADDQSVLKQWEGLGYYRRALNLHQAAKLLIESNRQMPTTAQELRELPGIGDYTAAAIAAIAFHEPVAAIDGNVQRVLSRLFAIRGPAARSLRVIRRRAAELICPTRPGDFNQALMDLGSSVCTPVAPRCRDCPLRNVCRAFKTDRIADFPRRATRKPPIRAELVAAIFTHSGRMLVVQSPEDRWWAGCWEFPTHRIGNGAPITAFNRLCRSLHIETKSAPTFLGSLVHLLTHRRLTLHVLTAEVSRRIAARRQARWVTRRGFEALPVPTAHRRIARLSSVAEVPKAGSAAGAVAAGFGTAQ